MAEKLGVGLEFALAAGAAAQANAVDNLLALGVNVIAIDPEDSKAVGPSVKKANEAAVPVVMRIGDNLGGGETETLISSDEKEGGYLAMIEDGVDGLRIGVVKEGFAMPESEEDVNAAVRQGAECLAGLGAVVEEVSLPIHAIGRAIWTPTIIEGLVDLVMRHNACGTNQRGLFVNGLTDAHGRWRQHADELSPSLKTVMLAGEFLSRQYGGRFDGKSQNLTRSMRASYEAALKRYDLLLMPTTPQKATALPPPDAPIEEVFDRALGMNRNTAPFCTTGHPAISIPCGTNDGLPIGLMLIGRHFEEALIYRAAQAFETAS